jgi:hypothetical protein
MADLVDRIRREVDARIEQLRPLVRELERLERAAVALAHAGARAVPGLGAGPPGPAGAGPPAPAAARPEAEPAGRSTRAKPAARTPPTAPRGATSGHGPAPRGQTQAKVLAALRAAPGSSSAAVATAAGIPTNTAAATLSRLVKQGRVRRLDEGGYVLVETPAGAAQIYAAPATIDAAAAASDTPDAQAPATPDTETP